MYQVHCRDVGTREYRVHCRDVGILEYRVHCPDTSVRLDLSRLISSVSSRLSRLISSRLAPSRLVSG